ncbi:hypothetical protein [Bradyrhizobium sp.]|uniref:hypothetical protein n=1 Tax=Bradyrhizobium sp. TaxID=376 RepID=UPI001D370A63|nr:hypothetical protein [Bradyrhizobium sp.]MBI5320019.1 hypothetical protein [Bradyrhizobium sp.]
MRPQVFVIVVSLAAIEPATAGGLLDKVQDNIKGLVAKDLDARTGARDIIKQQYELSPVPEQTAVTDALLQKVQSSPNSDDRAGAAIALSKLTSPWVASDHDNKLKALYQTYLDTQDPSLRRSIDDALSNAKGLYLDAINDFNSDNVANPAGTAAKFQRMPDNFPKSRYAASSAYYLGQYWTRVGFIRSNFADNIPKSDTAFTSFIQRSNNGDFASQNFLTDAYFFKALNRILVGKENETLAQLADMKGGLGTRNPNIYVYQLFYKTRDKTTEVDRYIPAQTLIEATVKFIQANPGRLPEAQSELAKQLQSLTKS